MKAIDERILMGFAFFKGLDEADKQLLLNQMKRVELKRGEVLFHEKEIGRIVYLVIDGRIKLGLQSGEGRENLLAIIGPGEMIGELTLIDPGPRSATATATTATVLLSLEHEILVKFLEAHPKMALHFMQSLAQRLRKSNEALSDLVFSDVPGRVAKTLLDMARRFGRETSDGVHVPHELTQEDMARLVGASRETVNKSLSEFVQRGWIRLEGRTLTLLDVPRLEKRAN